jgi:N-acetylglucosaminyldiphosphoundecaprenol N-acetyl-beta-D-mannosaminyltransferase
MADGTNATLHHNSLDTTVVACGFEQFSVRGTQVAAVDLARATDLIGQLATTAQGAYVTVTGAHGIVDSVHNDRTREAHQHASMVVPDGMPLVWLGRLLGFDSIGRVYGPDLMASIFLRSEFRPLRHYFYGSTPAVISKLTTTLSSRFGEFNFIGAYSPPIRPAGFAEDEEVIRHIRELKPHIVWVGLSTPKQEIWLYNHMQRIGSGVGIGVGAAFDLVSGTTRQAPRWIQRSGLEWVFRLAVEPKRLLARYLFIVPRFLYYMAEALIVRQARSLENSKR